MYKYMYQNTMNIKKSIKPLIKRHLEITVKNKDQHSITLINSIGYTFKSVCNKGIKCTYRMYMNIH